MLLLFLMQVLASGWKIEIEIEILSLGVFKSRFQEWYTCDCSKILLTSNTNFNLQFPVRTFLVINDYYSILKYERL